MCSARAFAGQPFDHRGTTVQITPPRIQPGGPPVLIGGAVTASAHRAAELGDGFYACGADRLEMEALFEIHRADCMAAGRTPGRTLAFCGPLHIQVSEDPERTWSRLAPHAFGEMDFCAKWASEGLGETPFTSATERDVDDLMRGGLYRVLTPEDAISLGRELQAVGQPVMLAPLVCRRISAGRAWSCS
jgi:alkanesulfonate monooxygenase SsuD/methylene tetrahydromethanopterin reductase-like flavin-dependent oxidoreductase (luciferase family)